MACLSWDLIATFKFSGKDVVKQFSKWPSCYNENLKTRNHLLCFVPSCWNFRWKANLLASFFSILPLWDKHSSSATMPQYHKDHLGVKVRECWTNKRNQTKNPSHKILENTQKNTPAWCHCHLLLWTSILPSPLLLPWPPASQRPAPAKRPPVKR